MSERRRCLELSEGTGGFIHIHIFNKHIPSFLSYTLILVLASLIAGLTYSYAERHFASTIVLDGSNGIKSDLVYGSWPALENENFFRKTRDDFIENDTTFIEANLSSMVMRYYEKGEVKKEVPIVTKGREGSWWETPAGLYEISTKEKNHFSSFGRVNMPNSMQFQGNFFIHGPTSYPDGTPTPSSYSGGCIRLSMDDSKEIFDLAEVGVPLLVFEDSFNGDGGDASFKNKGLLSDDISYLAVDLNNNFVFAKNKSTKEQSVASITKLLTALTAVEYINVEKEVYITQDMLIDTSIPRLNVGDSVAVLDLLSLLLQESSNEAAKAIPSPLGENHFVNLMNTKADAIGMSHSEFVDTSGVLSGNVSTAEDLFHLSKYLYHNRSFVLNMTMGKENRIAYGPARYPYLQNFNDIPDVYGEVGGKTGISSSAGNSMLSIVDINISGENHPVAVIVLGSDDAPRDIGKLVRYIRDNFAAENTPARQ